VTHIAIYGQATSGLTINDFKALVGQLGAAMPVAQRPALDFAADVDVAFKEGWQYLLPEPSPNLVVLHNSLLPRHRGFAPTVNALLAGESALRLTAMRPGPAVDDGPILAQSEVQLTPFFRISGAPPSLRGSYMAVAGRVCEVLTRGQALAAQGRPHDEARASYSQWRDEFDYLVDLRLGAEAVLRQIRAVGPPCPGAIAFTATGETLLIDDAEIGTDVTFVNRTLGKVYALAPGHMDVVYRRGMARIARSCTAAPSKPKLRPRLVDLPVASMLLMQARPEDPPT